MGGRNTNPGEYNVFDLIDQRNVMNRTIRAQIVTVDHEDGFVRMNYDGYPGGAKVATVPPLWMSFPKVGGAAWGRFMPQPSDIVKIGFDYDDRPRIIGYDVIANKDGVADGHSGWPHLNALYQRAKEDPSAYTDVNVDGYTTKVSLSKFAQFTPLYPGEYDFMSSGGAYIYGNRFGRLYLAGGAVSISLSKDDFAISSVSQVLTHMADDCSLRFGQVRRPSASQLDKKLAIDSNGSFKEFSVMLRKTITPGTSVDVASIQLGNVVLDNGTSTEKLDGNDARFLLRTHTSSGSVGFESIVDSLGNCKIVGSITASAFTIDYPMGEFIGSFTNGFTVNSNSINFQDSLGTPALHPLILSNFYRIGEINVLTQLTAHILFLHSQIAAIAALLQAGGLASTPPVVGAILMGKIFQGGSAAIVSALAAYLATPVSAPAALTTFIASYDTFLSKIAKTG